MTVTILHGDARLLLRSQPDARLVYVDPPFYTQKDWKMSDGRVAYSDKWDSFLSYITFIQELMEQSLPIIRNGSFVLHVDPSVSHYAKVIGDDVFGRKNFASEIIWKYRRWPTKTKNFQRMHDVLLRWTVGEVEVWNQQYEPLAPSTLKQWGTKKQKANFDSGERKPGGQEDADSLGAPMADVWDTSILAPMAKERTGYPTQKPVALLERLILSLTNPGDLVIDPCAGSGTTLAAAVKHGRRAIGIDLGEVAVETMKSRLASEDAHGRSD